jgi:hypothetical protein
MKRISLLVLACASSLNAEISYNKLYTETALLTGGIGAAGWFFSQMCVYKENKPWVQGIFYALAAASGTSYYMTMHPETRMNTNKNSFKSAWNSDLFLLVMESFKSSNQDAILNNLIRQISLRYIDSRNPFYNAFEDIKSLKQQYRSVLEESRLLLNFYSSSCYNNDSYRILLEEQIDLSQKAIELVTEALLIIKNTQEYKDAVNLQVQIEKQQAMARMALAQQTQALNSYRPSTVIIR